MEEKWKKIVLALLGVIGVLLIIISFRIPNAINKAVMLAVGSSIVGASLSNYIGLMGVNVNQLIRNTGSLPFGTKDPDLQMYRHRYYCYWVSNHNGLSKWRCGRVDFSERRSGSYLTGKFHIQSDRGDKLEYEIVGLVVDRRLQVLSKSVKGDQEISLYTFPRFTSEQSTYSVGFGLFEDWDNNEAIAPMIICKSPISKIQKVGDINNRSDEETLWEMLNAKFPNHLLC